MFIKPVEAPVTTSVWTEHAANSHFVLESQSASIFKSLISVFSNTGKGTDLERNGILSKSISDYEFRILLKCLTKGVVYIVAVSDTLSKIHKDWNWVMSQ